MTAEQTPTELPMPRFTDPRRVSVDLHDHLRRLIIDSALPPGSVLKQAQLARLFGVSRTPMREAFRMLQEEGLIAAETNQWARVRDFDANELDQLYGVRIVLESLGARLTAGRITALEVGRAKNALATMDDAKSREDMDSWVAAHRLFHRLCVARADGPLIRVIDSYSERSERYLRPFQSLHPQSFSIAHDQHEQILQAVVDGDSHEAGSRIAHHLANTSLAILRDVSPDAPGGAIREALAMAAHDSTTGSARRTAE